MLQGYGLEGSLWEDRAWAAALRGSLDHRRLVRADPQAAWEACRTGRGTVPLRYLRGVRAGELVILPPRDAFASFASVGATRSHVP